MNDEQLVDARGLLCPLPVLKLRKKLQSVPSGTLLQLLATDPAAVVDVPHFCMESGHELVEINDDGTATTYSVRKA
ncbi:sulfurtransferase TusA family protein [Octadecabacter arcticus]|jgi:tRNA 2-thiouridine synthesizing protein A|uniref:sulfurtransferase TusA family protein n=1 Tax=Octadecabacter arcticus TaxID=53946 RepID=UPI0005C6E1DC|nr:sulfurtransferase TusA family protein [Octadecabacter arcticus]